MTEGPVYTLGLVEWLDAAHRDELADGDSADPITLLSVGFLVEPYREGSTLVLAQERDEENGCWRHVTSIPGALILQVRYLDAKT